MVIKNKLLEYCWQNVNQRMEILTKAMEEIKQATFEETKRTAGDKHETGRAMMQLEQEKLSAQMADLYQTQQALERIKLELINGAIGEGSTVLTSQANYFIAISAGKAVVEGKTYFLISPMSPIGEALMGHKRGEKLNFRGQPFEILDVF